MAQEPDSEEVFEMAYSGIEAGLVEHVGEQQRRQCKGSTSMIAYGFGAFQRNEAAGAPSDLESVSSHGAHGMRSSPSRGLYRSPLSVTSSDSHSNVTGNSTRSSSSVRGRSPVSEVVYNFPRAGH